MKLITKLMAASIAGKSARRSALRKLLMLPLLSLQVLGGSLLLSVNKAEAATFSQCPAIGNATGCDVLIGITSSNNLNFTVDPTQGPYDGSDDQLVAVVNNSSAIVPAIILNGSAGSGIFGFDGDGACSSGFAGGTSLCNGATDINGYGGPNVNFTFDSSNPDLGQVNFTNGGLAPGQSAWFSLESAPTAGNPPVPTISGGTTATGVLPPSTSTLPTDPTVSTSVPEPSSAIGLLTFGAFIAGSGMLRQIKKNSRA